MNTSVAVDGKSIENSLHFCRVNEKHAGNLELTLMVPEGGMTDNFQYISVSKFTPKTSTVPPNIGRGASRLAPSGFGGSRRYATESAREHHSEGKIAQETSQQQPQDMDRAPCWRCAFATRKKPGLVHELERSQVYNKTCNPAVLQEIKRFLQMVKMQSMSTPSPTGPMSNERGEAMMADTSMPSTRVQDKRPSAAVTYRQLQVVELISDGVFFQQLRSNK